MKLKIKVTKDILRRSMMCGVVDNSNHTPAENCAIALAVRDVFPHAKVFLASMSLLGLQPYCTQIEPTLRDYVETDWDVTKFIQQFDELRKHPARRLGMPELEFTIEVPEAVIDTINIEALDKCETMELVGD